MMQTRYKGLNKKTKFQIANINFYETSFWYRKYVKHTALSLKVLKVEVFFVYLSDRSDMSVIS